MAVYTIELGRLLESGFNVGLDKYPIFDEAYRPALNKKIIEHYFFREIGFETAELFKRYLNTTLNEIMPYYNKLYESELLEFNPFYNVDKKETSTTDFDGVQDFNGKAETQTDGTATDTATGKTNSTTTAKNKKVTSDTPQGLLSIGNVEGEIYASQAEFNNGVSDTAGTSESTGNGTTHGESVTDTTGKTTTDNLTQYTRHVLGKEGGESYSEMLLKFRETFLNIDMLVLDDLKSCFMMIF